MKIEKTLPFVFFASSLLYNNVIDALRAVGLALILVFLTLIAGELYFRKPKFNLAFWGRLFFFAIVYLIGFYLSDSILSSGYYLILFLLTAVIVMYPSVDFNVGYSIKATLSWFLPAFCVVGLVVYLIGINRNYADGGFKHIYSTTTFCGVFCVLLTEYFIVFCKSKEKLLDRLIFVILALFVFSTKVRTAYIGLILVYISWFICSRTRIKSQRLTLLRYLTYALIGGSIFLYTKMAEFDFYNDLQSLVYSYTGKNLLTGRQETWGYALDVIRNNPIFGIGLAYKERWLAQSSIHNSYLEIILQLGGIGILAAFVFVDYLLSGIIKRNNNTGGIRGNNDLIYIFCLINLFMCTTEVMLFHGQIILQTMMWILIGYGISNNDDEYFVQRKSRRKIIRLKFTKNV